MIPHRAFPDVDMQALEAEIAREWAMRREVYPGRVAKGNMTAEEAEWQLRLGAAWAEDAARIRKCWFDRWTDAGRARAQVGVADSAPRHGVSWKERRAGLLRELDVRRRIYPRDIASGKLLERDATRRLAALECLLTIYHDGWDWFGSDGQLPGQSPTAAAEYAQLLATLAAEQGTAQVTLAL